MQLRRALVPALAVSLALAFAAPAAAKTPIPGLVSPSGNIRCLDVPGPPALLLCSLGHADYGAALERRCLGPDGMGVDWHGFSLAAAGRGQVLCSGGILWSPDTQRPVYTTVAYGRAWRAGPFACRSRTTGVTCTNRAGHGLFLARASWRVW